MSPARAGPRAASGVRRSDVRGGGEHNSAPVPHERRQAGVERVAKLVALGRRHAGHGLAERRRAGELDVPPLVEVRVLEGELDRLDLDVDEAGVLELTRDGRLVAPGELPGRAGLR